MTNIQALPLLALVLAVLASFFPFPRKAEPSPGLLSEMRNNLSGAILAILVIAIFGGMVALWPTTFTDGLRLTMSAALGAILCIVASGAGASGGGFVAGLAIFGASVLHLPPDAGLENGQVAFVVGGFIASFATGGLRPKLTSGSLFVLTSLLVVSADYLGKLSTSRATGFEPAASAGVALALPFWCLP